MKKVIATFSGLALAVSASAVSAQQSVQEGYIGANYAFLTYEEDGISEDFDLDAFVGKAGARFNPYVAAELRAGIGVGDDSVSGNGASVEVELDYLVGGYGIVGIPNETPIYPYVALGMTQGEVSASASGPGGSASASESESDVSYGIGANLTITEEVQVNAEYMNYVDKDGAKVSGISIGGQYLF